MYFKMAKFVVLLAFTIFITLVMGSNAPDNPGWEDFINFHKKSYDSPEEAAQAQENFNVNSAAVSAHNERFRAGLEKYTKELNQFADQDDSSFKHARRQNRIPENFTRPDVPFRPSRIGTFAAPDSWDWRNQNKVSPVKDQAQCGSCWAFSATAAMESQAMLKGLWTTFSEQQLVSCSGAYGNYGCGGGFYTNAWNYLKAFGGSESDWSYPYTSQKGDNGQCLDIYSGPISGTIQSFSFVGTDQEQIKQALVTYGPLSVAINADPLQLYSNGIATCTNSAIDHAVLLIGYGTDNGTPYWLIKNSWGPRWGQSGFAKIYRGSTPADCNMQGYAYRVVLN